MEQYLRMDKQDAGSRSQCRASPTLLYRGASFRGQSCYVNYYYVIPKEFKCTF